jgi:hypothetical protein
LKPGKRGYFQILIGFHGDVGKNASEEVFLPTLGSRDGMIILSRGTKVCNFMENNISSLDLVLYECLMKLVKQTIRLFT